MRTFTIRPPHRALDLHYEMEPHSSWIYGLICSLCLFSTKYGPGIKFYLWQHRTPLTKLWMLCPYDSALAGCTPAGRIHTRCTQGRIPSLIQHILARVLPCPDIVLGVLCQNACLQGVALTRIKNPTVRDTCSVAAGTG